MNDHTPIEQSLPHESGSAAEVLAATHLFTVEIVAVNASAWTPGEDGLEHRHLDLRARILQTLKGSLEEKGGQPFQMRVEQKREDALSVSDFYGFWSHRRDVTAPSSFLAIASGSTGDPAVLLSEPAIVDLLPLTLVSDVKLAIETEQRLGPIDSLGKVTEMFKVLYAHRQDAQGLFARYAWERLAPMYASAEDPYLTAILRIVRSADASLPLRQTLLNGLYTEAQQMGLTPERCRKLLPPFLQILLQEDAAPMLDRFLQVQIYNLVFRPGLAAPNSAEILADAAERSRIAEVAGRYRNSRAQQIQAWLRQ